MYYAAKWGRSGACHSPLTRRGQKSGSNSFEIRLRWLIEKEAVSLEHIVLKRRNLLEHLTSLWSLLTVPSPSTTRCGKCAKPFSEPFLPSMSSEQTENVSHNAQVMIRSCRNEWQLTGKVRNELLRQTFAILSQWKSSCCLRCCWVLKRQPEHHRL